MKLPFIASLGYSDKLKAQDLINRGADYPAIYFWFNLLQGHYSAFPNDVLQKDLEHMCVKYPELKKDFISILSNRKTSTANTL